MRKEIKKAFQVPGSIKVEKIEEEKGATVLHCVSKKKKKECPKCGGETKLYDWRTINKRHTVVGGKITWLRIRKRRMKCIQCKKVFMEKLEGLSRKHLTDHFTQQIQEKAKGQDFSTVSRETGVSCATVARRVWELPVPTIKEIKKRK